MSNNTPSKEQMQKIFYEVTDSEYECENFIGSGAYAVVCAAKHKKANKQVAIKKIYNWDDNTTEAARTIREIKLLRHFSGSPHILQLIDVFQPPSPTELNSILVVTERMDYDLDYKIQNQPISFTERKLIMHNILCGLAQIHNAGVIHRDLRPKNILMKGEKVVLCDFGMGRSMSNNLKMSLLQNTTCPAYCAPEGLIKLNNYNFEVDVWSAACIWAEMITKHVLIKPSVYKNCDLNHLEMILCICGIKQTENMELPGEVQKSILQSALEDLKPNHYDEYSLDTLLSEAEPEERELIRKMLAFNSNDRLTASECLTHPMFDKLNSTIEIKQFTKFDYVDPVDSWKLPKSELRRNLYEEIRSMHQK